MLQSGGVDHVIVGALFRSATMSERPAYIHRDRVHQTMDLHASQIQGFFDVPVDK